MVAHLKDRNQETKTLRSLAMQISPFVHSKKFRERGSDYKKIELFWPHSLLKEGIVIVDSPGIGESAITYDMGLSYLSKLSINQTPMEYNETGLRKVGSDTSSVNNAPLKIFCAVTSLSKYLTSPDVVQKFTSWTLLKHEVDVRVTNVNVSSEAKMTTGT
ncbi:hypothetical protein pdam_00000995 [Pocillopora damicornis]|uniref:Uncharacterized protein n=1 Tax=Pocillopora damicornis TaxID=46731 RepID=A0A3M6T5X3_POCDA|nr:hypothetical protein pdam_00000995 [Pocillopora damicornis]